MVSAHEYLVVQFEDGMSRTVFKIRKENGFGLLRIQSAGGSFFFGGNCLVHLIMLSGIFSIYGQALLKLYNLE